MDRRSFIKLVGAVCIAPSLPIPQAEIAPSRLNLLELLNATKNGHLKDMSKDIVHICLFISNKNYCEKCLETNLNTGKEAIYYRRYMSAETINEILNPLHVKYIIQTHSDSKYASLFIYKQKD